MSLDLYLRQPACPHCGGEPESVDFNYTYNVSPMWRAAVQSDTSMVYIDGMTGEESVPVLTAAIEAMEADPERFRAMNPPNGWGDFDTFLIWLRKVLAAAKENPTWVWESWR